MFTVCVRDHMMIAHSLRGKVFGPAQKLHGATYVVDVEFQRRALDSNGIVVDIGAASAALRGILATVEYRNLDELVEFDKAVTTTEYLARWVFMRMRAALDSGKLGENARDIEAMRVVLHESHIAWAAYEAPLKGAISG